MLSRRLFRQLTDSFLLGPRAGSLCFCAKRAAFVRQDSSRVFPRGTQVCAASSSTRWRSRQFKDHFAREAKVQGLKSRAAFKLVEVGCPHGAGRFVFVLYGGNLKLLTFSLLRSMTSIVSLNLE